MADDLISREAALEAARAGLKNFVGIQWTTENLHYVPKVVNGVRDALQNVPAIDAVEVVRCKDCDYAYINYFAEANGTALCRLWANRGAGRQAIVKQGGFCSEGERRADHGR